jgi:DNA-binding transcriptional LysR family regulator
MRNTFLNGDIPVFDATLVAYLLEVRRFGSIRKAADHLGVEPSVISRQLARLERALQVKLFHRSTTGVVPTEAGYLLADHAARVADDGLALKHHLAQLRGIQQATVRVSCGEGFVNDFLANSIAGFVEIYPQVSIRLLTSGTAGIVDAVMHGEADIGIAYNPELTGKVRSVAISRQRLCAILPSGHPMLERGEPITLADCLRQPHALLSNGFGIRALVNRSAADQGVAVDPILDATSIDALRTFVVSGLGVTFLPKFAVVREVEIGTVVVAQLPEPLFNSASVHLIVRANRRLPTSVDQLVSHIARTMSALN